VGRVMAIRWESPSVGSNRTVVSEIWHRRVPRANEGLAIIEAGTGTYGLSSPLACGHWWPSSREKSDICP
jgi:hypothetical protein